MKLAISKGFGLSLIAISVALTLASCATDAPPPAPPPPPPPAPAGPPVALAPEITDAASVYIDYTNVARAIRADFADGTSVEADLQKGAAFEPKQLSRGAVAYGAIVAMQEPSFRAALRAYAADDAARADMVSRIISNPAYAATIPSADNAARRVILALSSDGESVYKAGANVKQAAYDIQHQGWSKEFISGRDERLAMAKQNSVTLASVQSDESARLLAAALSGQGLVTNATTGSASEAVPPSATPISATTAATPAAAQTLMQDDPAAALKPVDFNRPDLFTQPYTESVNRSLAIAAIAILGEGGPSRADTLLQLLDNGDGPACLGMSKLNLYQCLAVAKPYYEDVFCLGQHVLMDTGQCIGKLSSNALSFVPPHKMMGINEDGTTSATAVAYLQPAKAVKCRKGKKCKATTAAPSTAKSTATHITSKKKKK